MKKVANPNGKTCIGINFPHLCRNQKITKTTTIIVTIIMMANIFFKSPISYVFRRINHLLNDLFMAIFGKIRSKMKEKMVADAPAGF